MQRSWWVVQIHTDLNVRDRGMLTTPLILACFSTKTRKIYKNDDVALIVKMKNPFDDRKQILVIAGKRYSGTRAAILAMMRSFSLIESRTSIVVQGFDRDYDGIIDDVEILEVR